MEANYLFYVVAIIGVLFHLVIKYRDSYTKNELFNWKYHVIFTLFSATTALFLVFFKPSFSNYIPDSFGGAALLNNYLTWALIGYFADSVWKNVENTGKAKLKID